MDKVELIKLIKLEYAKAEAYFGLAGSCDFRVEADFGDHFILNHMWPMYTDMRLMTATFYLSNDIVDVKLRVMGDVVATYRWICDKQKVLANLADRR